MNSKDTEILNYAKYVEDTQFELENGLKNKGHVIVSNTLNEVVKTAINNLKQADNVPEGYDLNWIDIRKIIMEDNSSYLYKRIVLTHDSSHITTITVPALGMTKLSDGSEYVNTSTSSKTVSHKWDLSKDVLYPGKLFKMRWSLYMTNSTSSVGATGGIATIFLNYPLDTFNLTSNDANANLIYYLEFIGGVVNTVNVSYYLIAYLHSTKKMKVTISELSSSASAGVLGQQIFKDHDIIYLKYPSSSPIMLRTLQEYIKFEYPSPSITSTSARTIQNHFKKAVINGNFPLNVRAFELVYPELEYATNNAFGASSDLPGTFILTVPKLNTWSSATFINTSREKKLLCIEFGDIKIVNSLKVRNISIHCLLDIAYKLKDLTLDEAQTLTLAYYDTGTFDEFYVKETENGLEYSNENEGILFVDYITNKNWTVAFTTS